MPTKSNSQTRKRPMSSYRPNRPQIIPKNSPYVYLQNGNIPAGRYTATIDKVKVSTTNAGKPAIDVYYTISDENGNTYRIKQRIAENTKYMGIFLDALKNAGVDIDEDGIDDIVGTSLDIEISYDDDPNGYGKIKFPPPAANRSSGKSKKAPSVQQLLAEDEDDEEDIDDDIDDFLDEDEDD